MNEIDSQKQTVHNEPKIDNNLIKQSRNTQQSLQQSKQLLKQNPEITAAIVKIQKNIRAAIIRAKMKEQFKRVHRRKRIIKQLVDTQENYIRDLGFIVSDFKMRMQSRGILTQEQGRKIFANVDQIRKLHDIFFSTIYNHFVSFHPYLIIFADVLNNIPYFRIYIDYLNNFPYACDLIDQYKKTKPAFASFVNELSKNNLYNFLSLEDYMVKPVQRLPKYVLLLKELIKNTHPTHPDYQNVRKALDKFSQVNSNNNQKLNKIRNSFKLRQLQSLLKLPQGIITASSQFLLEQTVQILNQDNDIVSNCVVYLLNNYIIVTKRCGALLNRQTQSNNSSSHSARVSQMYGLANSTMKQKLQVLVSLKYGTSVKLNKDQCFFKNIFVVQSPQGQSCTFICTTQDQLHNLYNKIKKQTQIVNQQTIAKLKAMFQNDNISHNSTFIKGISMLDLVPEINVLGTTERTDKMLKYTVYIVEVKVKMIKQKIFLRFSQLLQLERFINNQFRNKISIKQGLVNSSWLNNHHQKTIEQRKMNIQRFLKQILSKPEVIQNGWRILLRLGLPGDFYELPQKILQNKNIESFVKKSTVMGKSMIKKKNNRISKNPQNYRLSIFQQQKIQELEEQNEDEDNQVSKQMIIKSFENINPKSSYSSTQLSQGDLCIQDILKANQIDLGHYTRMESIDLSQNDSFTKMETNQTIVYIQILMPCLQTLYFYKKDRRNLNLNKYAGFRTIKLKCSKMQRIQNIIPLIAKQINIRYYKDFRLLIEKEYSQRVLDDDELVHKILGQINRTNSFIVLRKIIYIDHEIEEKQLAKDKQRLFLLASQVINQIKMGKYRLNYQSYLKFSVLSTIVHQQSVIQKQKITQAILTNYAKQAKNVIFPKYSSLSQTQDIWIKDFIKAYNIMLTKLKQVIKSNFEQVQKQKKQNMVQFHQQNSQITSNSFFWINTKLKYLTLLSIVKQIQKNQIIFGCMEFPVQISQQFKKYLQTDASIDIQNIETINGVQSKLKYLNSQASQTRKSTQIKQRDLKDEQNKNCWLAIKHDKIIFTPITKSLILLELQYQNLSKIQTYASAVVFQIKNMSINKIKLKTTSSYYIRQMIVYYKNYRSVLKKICSDSQLRDSLMEMARDQLGIHPHQEMDEEYV